MGDRVMAGLLTILGLGIGCAIVFVLRDDIAQSKKVDEVWVGALVTKICRDGTYIFHLKDGRYVTGGLGSRTIENPATVCQN